MPPTRPLSLATVAVLKSVADGTRFGFDIMDATGLPSGTVYPILGRLEKTELLRGKWEAVSAARKDKRPPRRYYEISGAGARALAESIEHYRSVGGLLPVAPLARPARR